MSALSAHLVPSLAALEPTTVGIVFAMAAATYATKAGGLWLVGRLDLAERERAATALEVLPGVIVVSIVAGELQGAGPRVWAGATVVAIVTWKTESLPLALVAGVGSVLILRSSG